MRKIKEFPELLEVNEDVYLLVQDANGITYKIARSNFLSGLSESQPENETEFIFKTFADPNGLFYYLGTAEGAEPYQNPHTRGLINVTASSTFNSSYAASNLLDRADGNAHTSRGNESYFIFDLGQLNFQLTSYTIRARTDNPTQIPRNWKFQGALTNGNWEDLDVRSSQTDFTQGVWKKLDVTTSQAYNKFRFLQAGNNSSSDTYLTLGEIELYGSIL